jgi:hypothetical protein
MRLEIVNSFIRIHSGFRRKKCAVTGMHVVFLSLQQIGTGVVYSSSSSGPFPSNVLLETVGNVDDSELFDLHLDHILTLSVYDT